MLIRSLTIENFKGIREPQTIEMAPVTLLFGPNSAGKSTVLQALGYLAEILVHGNLNPDRTHLGGESIDLGGFKQFVHGHDTSRKVKFRIDLDLSKSELPDYLAGEEGYLLESANAEIWPDHVLSLAREASVRLTLAWSELLGRVYVESYSVDINGVFIGAIERLAGGRDVRLRYLEVWHPIFAGDGAVMAQGDFDARYENAGDIELVDPADNWLDELGQVTVEEGGHESPSFADYLGDAMGDHTRVRRRVGKGGPLGLGGILLAIEQALPPQGARLTWPGGTWRVDYGDMSQFPLGYELIISSVLSGLLVGPADLLRRELAKMLYLGPMRTVPERAAALRISAHARRWDDGSAAWDLMVEDTSGRLTDRVNDWLAVDDRLGTGYRLDRKEVVEIDVLGPIYAQLVRGALDSEESVLQLLEAAPRRVRLTLFDERQGVELELRDVGVGLSQLIPVIVAACQSESTMVVIEQPELHVHPRWQVALGDLFLDRALKEEILFLLETHSEHLMLRLLRRIRETFEDERDPMLPAVLPEHVAVNYVAQKDGVTVFQRLRIRPDGDFLDRWPEGFFEERARELF